MKIYTKTGDNGTTGLIGGTRVPKHHLRIEACGTTDELNSCIGMIRSYETDEHTKDVIINIQDRLFTIGSVLASDPERSEAKLPDMFKEYVENLEKEIDNIENDLSPLKSFILPGGHPAVTSCHISRTVCRRAERRVSRLAQEENVSDIILIYLNRLSDYLFTLSRKLSKDFNVDEISWNAKLCK